jgi:hypothetical protein
MAFLAAARRKMSVWQEMDVFPVRTEIYFRADGYRNREWGERLFQLLFAAFSAFFLRLKKKENPRGQAYLPPPEYLEGQGA